MLTGPIIDRRRKLRRIREPVCTTALAEEKIVGGADPQFLFYGGTIYPLDGLVDLGGWKRDGRSDRCADPLSQDQITPDGGRADGGNSPEVRPGHPFLRGGPGHHRDHQICDLGKSNPLESDPLSGDFDYDGG